MAFRNKFRMTEANDRSDAAHGIEGVLLANRDRIIRFLSVRGAGDAAEDLFQDLWMRLTERHSGPVADPHLRFGAATAPAVDAERTLVAV